MIALHPNNDKRLRCRPRLILNWVRLCADQSLLQNRAVRFGFASLNKTLLLFFNRVDKTTAQGRSARLKRQNGQLANFMRLGNEDVPSHRDGGVGISQYSGDDGGVNVAVPAWKRVLDVGCVIMAMPLLLPLMVAIAAVIKCASPGPVLFLQERVGLRGRRFICFKFRTMRINADAGVHQRYLVELIQSDKPMVKMDAKCDPRLIPCGSVLRATGLDELPQILNVLGGQMSLVGPRPCLPYEYENYEPGHKRRFDTLPGLTGLWQVSGKNKTTFSEMIALDVRYAREKSVWMDFKIMARTIPALVAQVRDMRRRRKQHRTESPVSLPAPPYVGDMREPVQALVQK